MVGGREWFQTAGKSSIRDDEICLVCSINRLQISINNIIEL